MNHSKVKIYTDKLSLEKVILFKNQSTGADHWLWNFGDVLNSLSALKDPSFNYAIGGNYTINLLVTSSDGCTDTVSHPLLIEEPGFIIYIPDAFTPNDDHLNDFFVPTGSGLDLAQNFEMFIFDRWGEKVYHTTDIKKPWEGTYQNGKKIVQQDVFIYKIMVKDEKSRNHYYVGHVTLIK